MKPSRLFFLVLLAAAAFAVPPKSHSRSKSLTAYDGQVKQLLSQMTLDEKIGQMTQVDQHYLKDPNDIATLALGSVLSGGDSDPADGNSLEAWTDMYDRYQKIALKSRLGIPILYGVDAVHGHNNVLGATIFPHDIGLGCTRDADLVEKIGQITAQEVRATGINWAFAPCVAVPQDIRWGRTYEGFSEDPKLVRELGAAEVRGLQGTGLDDPDAVLACAKHYVGDGATTFGTGTGPNHLLDQGDMSIDEATLRKIHLQGYLSTIDAGVASVMPSYSSWNGLKDSANKKLLTDILKQELGFEGIVISDYNAIDQINKDYKQAIEASINAGMDMAMVTGQYHQYIEDLKALVQEGKVPMSRIDDAVTRILRVKYAMGLMDKKRSPLADRSLQATFGSPEHRNVARQAVRESLVLLVNKHKLVPLSRDAARIHVAGAAADDLGYQCGGWTIDWQGKLGRVTTGGTTFFAAIQQTVSKNTKITYSKDGTGADGADVGVAVIGEKPYAEMFGDRKDLSLDPADIATVKNLKKAGIPVVVILYSGRPLILDPILDDADAIIAAWLPGTEGEGITDVLFGDYAPTGKLSFTWPRSMAQVPININQKGKKYDPLFKYGYGLK